MANLLELQDGVWVNVDRITCIIDDLTLENCKERCWVYFGDVVETEEAGLPLDMLGCEVDRIIRECE